MPRKPPDGAELADLRSYGRRRGRKLSPRQTGLLTELLPRIAVELDAPAALPAPGLFAEPKRALWLEIGFGGGEHLVWQAKQNPDVGLIGCEPFEEGDRRLIASVRLGKTTTHGKA